jgi:hypothetical protein
VALNPWAGSEPVGGVVGHPVATSVTGAVWRARGRLDAGGELAAGPYCLNGPAQSDFNYSFFNISITPKFQNSKFVPPFLQNFPNFTRW